MMGFVGQVVDRGMDRCIETFRGVAFPVLEPRAELVDVWDIAHALSNICHYGGHVRRFMSVAEHSVHVSELLEQWGRPDLAMAGLMHDAAEAYVGDMLRPLKYSPVMAAYREVEARVDAAVRERFGIVLGEEDEVVLKRADDAVVRAEARELMKSKGEGWAWNGTPVEDITFWYCTPQNGAIEFLSRFWVCGGKTGE